MELAGLIENGQDRHSVAAKPSYTHDGVSATVACRSAVGAVADAEDLGLLVQPTPAESDGLAIAGTDRQREDEAYAVAAPFSAPDMEIDGLPGPG